MRVSRVLGRLGVGLTLAAAVALLVVPMYGGITQTFSASVGPDGQIGPEVTSQVVSHATLLEVNGRWVLIPLALLVLFAVVAAWGRPRWMRWVGVGLFGALTVLGALSIGAFLEVEGPELTGAGSSVVHKVVGLGHG